MLPERGDQHEGSRTRTCKNMRSRNDDEHQEEEEEEEEPDRLGELREEQLRPCFSLKRGRSFVEVFCFLPPGAPRGLLLLRELQKQKLHTLQSFIVERRKIKLHLTPK